MRVHSFSSGNDNSLNADKREGSVDKGRKETEKVTSRSLDAVVVDPCSRVVPVAKTDSLFVWTAASSDDNSDNDQADETGHFDGAGDNLCLTEEANVHEVDAENQNETDGDDNSWADIGPISDQHSSS